MPPWCFAAPKLSRYLLSITVSSLDLFAGAWISLNFKVVSRVALVSCSNQFASHRPAVEVTEAVMKIPAIISSFGLRDQSALPSASTYLHPSAVSRRLSLSNSLQV